MYISYQEKVILVPDHKPSLTRLLLRCLAAFEQLFMIPGRHSSWSGIASLPRPVAPPLWKPKSPAQIIAPLVPENGGGGYGSTSTSGLCALPNPVCRSPWRTVGEQ